MVEGHVNDDVEAA